MRYLLVLIDGLADTPLEALGGKTPLEAAATPALDKYASTGLVGCIRTVPRGFAPETLAALFNLLGYPPGHYLTGRGYYEALAAGLMLAEGEWCFRLQFVTVENDKLVDPRAGGLTEDEGRSLLRTLEQHFKQSRVRFVQGHGHNHLMVVEGVDFNGLTSVSPFNVIDAPLVEHRPQGAGAETLLKLMEEAPTVLSRHEVNLARRARKLPPANGIWLWGGGTTVEVPGFQKTFGMEAAVVSNSSLLRGVGVATGMKVLTPAHAPMVPDPSGRMPRVEPDTAVRKAARVDEAMRIRETALHALESHQLVIAQFSYPDDFSHQGDAQGKLKAIELIDRHFFKPLQRALQVGGDLRLIVVPTLMSRVETRQHDDRPVPYLMWGPGVESAGAAAFTEGAAEKSPARLDDGTRLIDYMMTGP